MFKSLFSKYITVFMVIMLISYVLLAGSIGLMVVRYSSSRNAESVSTSARIIQNAVVQQFGDSVFSDFNQYVYYQRNVVVRELNIAAQYADGLHVLLVDVDGNVLASDDGASAVLCSDRIDLSCIAFTTEGFDGESDLGGVLPGRQQICALKLFDDISRYGYVFVCSDSSSTVDFVQGIMKTIFVAGLWVLAAALIAVYFISERIIAPIRKMRDVAQNFAQGHFDARIPVDGKDEISELAIAFNNMAVSLENMESTRSTFIGNVSHELRTPMTTISGFVDAMLDGAIPEEKHNHYLGVISGEVKRLSRLVSSLLDITRIQAGERKFVRSEFNICETAQRIILSCEQRLNEKHLEVEYIADEDDMYVYADPDAIYQVLYNLCDNAIKFSREGGRYRVSILRNNEKIFVSVFNEGAGIPSEELPFVFERFYKADKSRGLDKTGLGLGLYICKAVMDAHDEEIWVKSEHGHNCEFVFTLQSALRTDELTET